MNTENAGTRQVAERAQAGPRPGEVMARLAGSGGAPSWAGAAANQPPAPLEALPVEEGLKGRIISTKV